MKHATKSSELGNNTKMYIKKRLTVVAIKHTIEIGSSRSSFPGPSLMDDEKRAVNLSANEPQRVLVKKQFSIDEMMAGCMKGCFVFGFPA